MTPTPTTTGPGSTSFAVWLATFLPGLASGVTALLQHGTPTHTAVFGIGGGVMALVSTLGKLFHDKGLHVATIQAAGSDIAAELPSLRTDIAKTVAFAETDLPVLKPAIDSVTSRVSALEAKVIPDASTIEGIVRNVLTSVLTPAAVAPVAPVVPPVPPAA